MHDFEEIEHDGTIESSLFNIKKSNESDDIEKFKTIDVLGQKVDIMTVFERTNIMNTKGR